MLTVRIQEKNHSESIMVLKLKDGYLYQKCQNLQENSENAAEKSRLSGISAVLQEDKALVL